MGSLGGDKFFGASGLVSAIDVYLGHLIKLQNPSLFLDYADPTLLPRTKTMKFRWIWLLLLLAMPGLSRAQAVLTAELISWNVIGLDSNKVTDGPNQYYTIVRVTNTGTTAATNVTATLNWLTANQYINLTPGAPNPDRKSVV